MKELFKQQLEHVNPITEELLNELQQKNYDSGEPRQVGDKVLYGFKSEIDQDELSLTLFSLCEREFEYYKERYTVQLYTSNPSLTFPIFIPKGEEDQYNQMKNNYLQNNTK